MPRIAVAVLLALASGCALRTAAKKDFATQGGVPCRPGDMEMSDVDELNAGGQRFEVKCRGETWQCAAPSGPASRQQWRCSRLD